MQKINWNKSWNKGIHHLFPSSPSLGNDGRHVKVATTNQLLLTMSLHFLVLPTSEMVTHVIFGTEPGWVQFVRITATQLSSQTLKTSSVVARGEVVRYLARFPVTLVHDEALTAVHVLVEMTVNEPHPGIVCVEPHYCCSEHWEDDHVLQDSSSFPLS